jgi:hypothetical protein
MSHHHDKPVHHHHDAHKPHLVRVRGWQNGELYVGQFSFDSYEEALEFAKEKHKTYGHHVKVYNPFEELLEEFAEWVIHEIHEHYA